MGKSMAEMTAELESSRKLLQMFSYIPEGSLQSIADMASELESGRELVKKLSSIGNKTEFNSTDKDFVPMENVGKAPKRGFDRNLPKGTSQSIRKLLDDNDVEVVEKKIWEKLLKVNKRMKSLAGQLGKNGIAIIEDIPYEECKENLARITERLQEIRNMKPKKKKKKKKKPGA